MPFPLYSLTRENVGEITSSSRPIPAARPLVNVVLPAPIQPLYAIISPHLSREPIFSAYNTVSSGECEIIIRYQYSFHQNRPLIFPFSSQSILRAAGAFGSPGIVITSPV